MDGPPGWKLTALDAVDAEGDQRLFERMKGLPRLTRQVVTLRKVDGLSQQQIAARLGISADDVMKHLSDAIRACADLGDVADA